MTAIREAIRRLAEPDAISWPVFWITYVINVIIALVSGFDAEATWWQRVVAATAGQVAMFTFLVLMRLLVLHRFADRNRGIATLVGFIIAGAIRGLSVSAAFIVLGPSGPEVLIPRLPAGISFGLVVLVPASLVLVTLRTYRNTRSELILRRAELESARATIIDTLERRDSQVEQQVRDAFAEAVDEELPREEAVTRLMAFTTDVVRPLSHQLAGSVETIDFTTAPSQAGRVTIRGVLERGTRGSPFLPWSTALTAALLSASWFIWEEGLLAAIVYLTGGVLGVVIGLSAANAVLERTLTGRSLPIRITMVVAGALFAGAVFGVVATLLASSTPWIRALWAAGLVFYPIFALILVAVRAANSELRSSVTELRRVDADLAWQVARLHQMQWVRQRTTARALHGPVQAMVAAAVRHLGAGADEQAVLLDLRTQLGHVLDPQSAQPVHTTWREALTRIEATWQGVCEIVSHTDGAASRALDRDAIGAEIVVEIISEAVSNAVRHGKAHIVTIDMTMAGEVLHVEMSNDGQAPASFAAGLGTRLLDDCAITWTRSFDEGTVTLTATLPLDA